MIITEKGEIFHVHTFRCGHAAMVPDEAYVEKAIELGAGKITFTDHAPFPGNPFGNRMDYEELDEYVESIRSLQEKYAYTIQIGCGLEIEYLPSFKSYYEELRASERFDVLLLGQHIYEHAPGVWNFSVPLSEEETAMGLFEAQIEGLATGYFDVLAHPDRCFHRFDHWTSQMETASMELIRVAEDNGRIPLEKNVGSISTYNMYWPEFWELVDPDYPVVVGCDAHDPRWMLIWNEVDDDDGFKF
ncbi:MAG: PHP domain-containing protein [Lachnospiraceae bacterium]|nr:PHP domain-containing protein [Lachnospiraceae bacterium]